MPFEVYARGDTVVMVDTLSAAEVDEAQLRRAGITDVPVAWRWSIRGPATCAGRPHVPVVGIVEPWIASGGDLDDVRRTVMSRAIGDQQAFASLVDVWVSALVPASVERGEGDVTSAVIQLLGERTVAQVVQRTPAPLWSGELVRVGPFTAAGKDFVIDCNDAELATTLAAWWPPAARRHRRAGSRASDRVPRGAPGARVAEPSLGGVARR